MEDDRASVDTNYTVHQPTRTDLTTQQNILDQINKNTKDLVNFLNYNLKLRTSLGEMVQSYLTNNEERLRYFYLLIKDCLKVIENNTISFNRQYASIQNYHSISSKDDFNSIFAERNNEVSELILKSEFNHKHNFTISIFKSLLDSKKDEILRDILKDDYILHIKNTVRQINLIIFEKYFKILGIFKQQPQANEKTNDIPTEIIEDLNKKFNPNIHITRTDKELYQIVTITVQNSFVILLKTSKEFQYMFEMNVCAIDEYNNISSTLERKERKFMNLLKRSKVEEKSKYKVMRKISMLLEDRLFILLRYLKPPFKIGFYLFIHFIASFSDIFKKKCSFCKFSAKLNLQDKCFYPPFYKFMDLEKENVHHFHEECYNYINNALI